MSDDDLKLQDNNIKSKPSPLTSGHPTMQDNNTKSNQPPLTSYPALSSAVPDIKVDEPKKL